MSQEESGKTLQAAAVSDYTRYVQFMYLTGTAIATWLLSKIIGATWGVIGEPVTPVVVGVSVGVSVTAALALWRYKRVKNFAYEVVTELSKVTWPTRKELYAAVVAVIVVSIIVSMILFLFDAFWSWVTTYIYEV